MGLTGCEKNPFDYRSKFLGNYDFSIHHSAWNLNGTTLDTTYNYSGEIMEGELFFNTTVQIKFADNVTIEAELFEDGTLGTVSNYNSSNSILKGEFESPQKVNFVVSWNGLGGGNAYNVLGAKQ